MIKITLDITSDFPNGLGQPFNYTRTYRFRVFGIVLYSRILREDVEKVGKDGVGFK